MCVFVIIFDLKIHYLYYPLKFTILNRPILMKSNFAKFLGKIIKNFTQSNSCDFWKILEVKIRHTV